MNPEPPDAGKNLGKDLKTFEQLPTKTKDLHILTDQAEKSSGKERAALNRLIQKKSR